MLTILATLSLLCLTRERNGGPLAPALREFFKVTPRPSPTFLIRGVEPSIPPIPYPLIAGEIDSRGPFTPEAMDFLT